MSASSPFAPLYLGVVIAGSSTLLVIKLFQEHFELDTEPGRLALGMLIFQDIWVIIVILLGVTFLRVLFLLLARLLLLFPRFFLLCFWYRN